MQQMVRRWHAKGAVNDERARHFEWVSMQPPEPLLPQEVWAIRESEDLEIDTFADMLNTSPRQLRRWEQGLSKPQGTVLRLLRIMHERGLRAVF
ncbi:helix-turn-helix domain-containing protein [Roseateles chitinivorans]|uniref:helix-turn-helix domain-containing protein n=1 Tax=Roseateles chitinivorans TaxID=2917965 RepID=UPI003D66A517